MPDAYCAPAPPPQQLFTAWTVDGFAIGGCVLLAIAFMARGKAEGDRRALGWALALLLLLFMSPLCALTTALFSARVTHHILLVAIVSPLLALAFPARDTTRPAAPLAGLALAHGVVIWFWHAPLIYQWAIVGPAPYWLMQLSLTGSGYLLWRRILADETGVGAGVLAIFATFVQMGMLGALLTFAPEPLYAPHFGVTQAYGLSPLMDQQLAGLIMWSPAALPYLVLAGVKLYRGLGAVRGALA